uniref:Uncharacterized protein n=1 Tax=Percolomonas cosmopolitus TaxID=63605 RepID=A0A7S1KRE9_9EUKA|mmetsp:Transcript_6363/g.23965  ORF Transcript_6363/g.23965 Transcript_6363/m.23965 type:complete len:263 (+) Transcript_6363:211-999(+)|eukprot:CAMPEP_0117434572 /NCGR_PEP_ID=MMETSP0759-20121206/22_1 /TAXON_ID=63605 /ORGANISM="Percolomonas cosmopolitus, Strain WS" /LENGTH=262 /DNA_ID=CAMNT_0005226067 /DNA_START=290 /DNA_END=1078 /DNA_ORIENTATION=-
MTLTEEALKKHDNVHRELKHFGCKSCRVHWRQLVRPTKPVSSCPGRRGGSTCGRKYDPLIEEPNFMTGKGKFWCRVCDHKWTSYNAEFFTPQICKGQCDTKGNCTEVYLSILRPPGREVQFICECGHTWMRYEGELEFYASKPCQECEQIVRVKCSDVSKEKSTAFHCKQCKCKWKEKNVEFSATDTCEQCGKSVQVSSRALPKRTVDAGRKSNKPANPHPQGKRHELTKWSREHDSTGSTISTGSKREVQRAGIEGLSLPL